MAVELNDVSIPHWYDYNDDEIFLSFWVLAVSIPHWYDYNCRTDCFEPFREVFQFHTGTIITSRTSMIRT